MNYFRDDKANNYSSIDTEDQEKPKSKEKNLKESKDQGNKPIDSQVIKEENINYDYNCIYVCFIDNS